MKRARFPYGSAASASGHHPLLLATDQASAAGGGAAFGAGARDGGAMLFSAPTALALHPHNLLPQVALAEGEWEQVSDAGMNLENQAGAASPGNAWRPPYADDWEMEEPIGKRPRLDSSPSSLYNQQHSSAYAAASRINNPGANTKKRTFPSWPEPNAMGGQDPSAHSLEDGPLDASKLQTAATASLQIALKANDTLRKTCQALVKDRDKAAAEKDKVAAENKVLKQAVLVLSQKRQQLTDELAWVSSQLHERNAAYKQLEAAVMTAKGVSSRVGSGAAMCSRDFHDDSGFGGGGPVY